MPYGTVNADVIGTSVAGSNLGAGNATLMKNRLIDAGFIINQRGYVSNTALSAGTYAHDRWKAGASGCTYTFTQGSLGVPIVIAITAGSLQQIIEGCNMPDGGTFTLSWTGTAQGRVNGGGYSTSPLIVTGLTAGANCTVEFNTGTCSFSQLEVGSSATGFEYVNYQTSLANCLRYTFVGTSDVLTTVFGTGATTAYAQIVLPVQMRATPTPTISGSLFVTANGASGGDITATSPTVSANGLSNIGGRMSIAGYNSALTNNSIYGGTAQGASGKITFSAEL